jgi:hypothetical protein
VKNLPVQALVIRAFAVSCAVFSADHASAVTITQASSPITVNGNSYNVFFNQETAASTTFNNVFGTGSPTLTFTNATDATAALSAIIANISPTEWLPLGLPSSGFAGLLVPIVYSTNGFNRAGANYLVPNGPPNNFGAPNNPDAFSRNQAFTNASFVTFQQVPEPSAIFGTLVFGLVGSASYLRRARRAS